MAQTRVASPKRTRIVMLVVLVCILAAFAEVYVFMRKTGAQRAAEHKISFYEYVVQHHVGQLTDIDDGTGFDPNSYVLTIDHRIQDAKIKEYALRLMKLYVMYDRGQALTVMVQPSPKLRALPMADVVYNDESHVVTLSVMEKNGDIRSSVLHVNW